MSVLRPKPSEPNPNALVPISGAELLPTSTRLAIVLANIEVARIPAVVLVVALLEVLASRASMDTEEEIPDAASGVPAPIAADVPAPGLASPCSVVSAELSNLAGAGAGAPGSVVRGGGAKAESPDTLAEFAA
ncbi:hypothetical protein NJB14197_28580 [Mycobacterium montefiorense]|uniref:Uncharacterized protein n=1 Tax=Mycobacterium montefiorense TaxID=154654 RepID=A0AA37PR87_9MYCO|nr:hypothetical protein MmonteBS_00820 [Mycobacterium montefiorense]GKU35859.1 hypothetical protein NJB14191_32050 [Mycobacterium montefiorense]GKU40761.1 hypothetical protein NJB14192_27480 [Mycobacterium montefiorense]GKU44300.1 hypothetical protein NJB14194_09280 [Mycobacterium montefiorense]GKU51804.1 hypothetical protein NJB14195_30490 [Mycobacterium montefiorense]